MKNTIRLNERTYEVVDKIPARFFVWNIGENMGSDEYIPLCECLHPGTDKDDLKRYAINADTLKAIKLPAEEVRKLRAAAGWGVNSKNTTEKALRSKRKGYISNNKRRVAAETLEIFRRITE